MAGDYQTTGISVHQGNGKAFPKARKNKKTIRCRKSKPLTAKEIEHYHQQLLTLRRELLGDMDQIRSKTLGNNAGSSGELSSMPVHMADVGTDNYEQEFTLDLIDSERKILSEIDLALSKVANGTYGICEIAGENIGKARLDAKPYARYCIDCATKIEKGLVKPDKDEEEE